MKLFLINILLIIPLLGFSQVDAEALFGLPNASTLEINGITGPINQGQLVFDTTLNKIYEYNGTSWNQLIEESLTVTEITGDYTLVIGDDNNVLTFNSNSDINLTIPIGLPETFNVSVYQIGTGKIQFTSNAGVIIKSLYNRLTSGGQDAGMGILATGTDEYHIIGDLK